MQGGRLAESFLCAHALVDDNAGWAIRNPDRIASASAFSPIVAASQSPWGRKALAGYLGHDELQWREWDAEALLRDRGFGRPILVDQGTADEFLHSQLKPHLLQAVCDERGVALTMRMQEGYDHSYFFISTFIGDHLRFHASALSGK